MGKILVADDSSTIQKVIRITLANEPYQLVECMDEEDLSKNILSNDYNLVLLDFNLSSSKTGLQLGAEIKEKCPDTQIMVMLGTFDSVDPAELADVGIDDSVVKPFESDIFIKKCHALMSGGEREVSDHENNVLKGAVFGDVPLEAAKEEVVTEDIAAEDNVENWEVNSPDIITEKPDIIPDKIDQPSISSSSSSDLLAQELEAWSMDVPGIIGGEEAGPELPSIIGDTTVGNIEKPSFSIATEGNDEDGYEVDPDSTSVFDIKKLEDQDNQTLPDEDDLAYPDNSNVEDMSEEDILAIGEDDSFDGLSTEMVSLDDLVFDSDEEIDFEGHGDKSDHDVLEKGIEEESAGDDIWAIDEEGNTSDLPVEESSGGIETNLELAEEVSSRIHEAEDDSKKLQLEESVPLARVDEPSINVEKLSINTDEIVEQLKVSLAPMIEQIVKDQCAEMIERVAWEVIPDLAENLVKKEIKNISDSVD